MKKMIAAFILATAAITPALASDCSENVMQSWANAGAVAASSMDAYAFAPRGNWQAAQDANVRHQSQIQWQITDR
jgi:opacity protein-like surface antigen